MRNWGDAAARGIAPKDGPTVGATEFAMSIDATHRPWLIAFAILALLTVGAWSVLPASTPAAGWQRILFGVAGTFLILFCALLPVRRKLQRLRNLAKQSFLRSAVWEKGHIWFGMLGCLLLHCHANFHGGGPLTRVLLLVLWAIIVSGLAGLLFRHLLPLVKTAKEGKTLLAARIIGAGHAASLRLHIPLTLTLVALGAVHAIVALLY